MTVDEPPADRPASGGRAAERRRQQLARQFGEDVTEGSGASGEADTGSEGKGDEDFGDHRASTTEPTKG